MCLPAAKKHIWAPCSFLTGRCNVAPWGAGSRCAESGRPVSFHGFFGCDYSPMRSLAVRSANSLSFVNNLHFISDEWIPAFLS